MRQFLIRIIDALNGFGYALIVGGVIYVIIGSVASLAQGEMMKWSFCGAAHMALGVEWCGYEPHTDETWFNQFGHRLVNVPLYFFMFFWGFLLVAVCSPLLKLLGFRAPWKAK